MRRILLLVCFALGATLSSAQSLTQKISYHAEAIPLKTVCEEIAEKTGVKLAAAGTLNSMLMVIDVKDVTVQDLMDRLAVAVEADWVHEAASIRLTRTSTFLRKKANEAYQKRLKAFTKAQKEMLDSLSKLGAFDTKAALAIVKETESLQTKPADEDEEMKRYERISELEGKLPKSRLGERVAVSLKPEVLAAMKKGDRVVLSTTPNRMQQPMPSSVIPAVKQFMAEQNVWADVLGGVPEPNYEDEGGWETAQLLSYRRRFTAAPAKVLLILTCGSEMSASVSVELQLLDAKGRAMAYLNTYISGSSREDYEVPEDYEKQILKLREGAAKEEPIKLNPLAEEFRAKLSGQYFSEQDEAEKKPISPELRAALLNPEKHDPLKFGATDILFALGKHGKFQLVAAPGDFMVMMALYMGSETALKASELLGMMLMTKDEDNPAVVDGEWLIFKRADFSEMAEFGSINRSALGQVIRQAVKVGRVSLDVQCLIALQEGEQSYWSLYSIYPSLLLDDPASQSMMYRYGRRREASREMMQLHGLLTQSQKQALINGGRIAIADLTPQQKQIVFDMIFKNGESITPPGQNEFDPEMFEEEEDEEDWEYAPQEPTELFPNGLPLDAFITLELEENPMVQIEQTYEGSGLHTTQQDPESIGYQLAAKEVGSTDMEMQEYYRSIEWKSFRMAKQTVWNYKFNLSKDAEMQVPLSDTEPTGAKVKRLEDLPSDIQDLIKKAKEEAIKEIKEQRKGDGGGGGGDFSSYSIKYVLDRTFSECERATTHSSRSFAFLWL
ncbi:MAG: hypothetical protein KF784_13115 [Fimbriimonadaceae bacterium]|nr:hypothetical protein [Fimbriimonadaceae bacterium]